MWSDAGDSAGIFNTMHRCTLLVVVAMVLTSSGGGAAGRQKVQLWRLLLCGTELALQQLNGYAVALHLSSFTRRLHVLNPLSKRACAAGSERRRRSFFRGQARGAA